MTPMFGDYGSAFAAIVGIIVFILAVAFIWEVARRVWYWAGAKIFGWSKQERFERETAWLHRETARMQRQAKRDTEAASNTDRRRLGANLTTFAIAALAWQFSLPWWEVVLIAAVFYVGIHMAAGLSFKLW